MALAKDRGSAAKRIARRILLFTGMPLEGRIRAATVGSPVEKEVWTFLAPFSKALEGGRRGPDPFFNGLLGSGSRRFCRFPEQRPPCRFARRQRFSLLSFDHPGGTKTAFS